jgi:hypothetical protein
VAGAGRLADWTRLPGLSRLTGLSRLCGLSRLTGLARLAGLSRLIGVARLAGLSRLIGVARLNGRGRWIGCRRLAGLTGTLIPHTAGPWLLAGLVGHVLTPPDVAPSCPWHTLPTSFGSLAERG